MQTDCISQPFLLEHQACGARPSSASIPGRPLCCAGTGATHQFFDCRVDVEAMAQEGSEVLGQLDGAIHQSVQLEINHAWRCKKESSVDGP
jgi:hypothetical protein